MSCLANKLGTRIILQPHSWCTLPYIAFRHSFSSEFSNVFDTAPVIRYPQALKRAILRRTKPKKMETKKSALNLAKPGKLLVSCDNRSECMFTNEYPNKFSPPSITSSTWTSRKSPGRHFTIHSTRENNPSFKESIASFYEVGLSEEILKALHLAKIKNPTVIQAKAIPEILAGKNVLMAAETGCGKTYAYLLPILRVLMQLESCASDDILSPEALILTPTKELSKQVVTMGKSLNLGVNFHSVHSSSFLKLLKKQKSMENTASIVVSTPVPMILALKRKNVDFGKLKFIVLDECDTLCDDSFSKQVQHILNQCSITKGIRIPMAETSPAQLLLCSATFPKYASEVLSDIITMENVEVIRSGYLHRVSPHVTHRFLRVRPSEKLGELVKVIESNQKKQTLVFCNTKASVGKVYQACQENAIPATLIDGSIIAKKRSLTVEDLKNGKESLLITTDLTSRGLDTQKVEHVINFEIPNNVSDYIHRCGRVGRIGQQHAGLVTNLVSKKWEIATVMKIEEAARRREEIEGVSANIKRRHNIRWEQKE
ncbi:unnamed protein product [Clavelina lepadiformis]|uniref:RNA helicase n=1 Tax=Clavelina lepadiformis TaxID=159417 RepID=A0ABP0FEK1_CLALP